MCYWTLRGGRPLLPSEILIKAQRELPALGLATVYRNIEQLFDKTRFTCDPHAGRGTRHISSSAPLLNFGRQWKNQIEIIWSSV